MLNITLKRVAIVTALTGTLFAGAAAVPAPASPANERLLLASLKNEWKLFTVTEQTDICSAYRITPALLVSQTAAEAFKDPAVKSAVTKAEFRRAVKAFYKWSCSGAGTTPR